MRISTLNIFPHADYADYADLKCIHALHNSIRIENLRDQRNLRENIHAEYYFSTLITLITQIPSAFMHYIIVPE